MHMIVMKEELASREPWLVESLCDAFQQAKERGRTQASEDRSEGPIRGMSADDTRSLFGDDPWPYGVEQSRHVLETFLKDVLDQKLIQTPMGVDDLFPPNLPERYA